MPHCAPPEAANPDKAGCTHCGRLASRKWLFATGERRVWFCAGEKAKHGCRSKARAANAIVWECQPTPLATLSAHSTALVGVSGFHASGSAAGPASAAPHAMVALPTLIQSAWRMNDPLLMSQALASAHRSGLSLMGALSLAMAPEMRSAEEARRAKFNSMLTPELLAALSEDGQACLACVTSGGKQHWCGNPAFEREFGMTDGVAESAKDMSAVFGAFMHPEDALLGHKTYKDSVLQLLDEGSQGVVCSPTRPTRLRPVHATCYHGYFGMVHVQLVGPLREPTAICKWTRMPQADVAQHWSESAMSTESVPLLIVEFDEPPPGQPQILAKRMRIVPRMKRGRVDEGGISPRTPSCGSEASSDESTATPPRSPCDENSAGLLWPVKELIDLVGA